MRKMVMTVYCDCESEGGFCVSFETAVLIPRLSLGGTWLI